MMRRRTLLRIGSSAPVALPLGALGQSYPGKPVTLVVPYPAGGPTDTLTRILAEAMQRALGQSILVENVTGASGAVGVAKVARAAPDGYMASVGHASSHITIWATQPGSFDLQRDMAPVAMFAVNPSIIVARKSMAATNLREFLDYLKANSGKATMGGALGTIGHLASLELERRLGTKLQFIPYRGGAPAMQDLLAGQIDMLIDQAANSLPQLHGGKIKGYAVTASTRLAVAPEVPTTDEAGLPGFYVTTWHGIWVPRATPAAIVDRLNAAAREALAGEALQRRFAELGQDIPPPEMQTVRALAEFQKAEVERWTPLLKAAGFKPD
jgi:tripartite-type tricarboxylate transporter receptor subunit TctC